MNRKSEASCHASEMCHGVHNVDSFLQRWRDNIQPRRTVNPLKEGEFLKFANRLLQIIPFSYAPQSQRWCKHLGHLWSAQPLFSIVPVVFFAINVFNSTSFALIIITLFSHPMSYMHVGCHIYLLYLHNYTLLCWYITIYLTMHKKHMLLILLFLNNITMMFAGKYLLIWGQIGWYGVFVNRQHCPIYLLTIITYKV